MRRAFLLLLSLPLACAPLNTATMSDKCRGEYNACMNACPQPAPNFPPDKANLQIDQASCTDACNKKSAACR